MAGRDGHFAMLWMQVTTARAPQARSFLPLLPRYPVQMPIARCWRNRRHREDVAGSHRRVEQPTRSARRRPAVHARARRMGKVRAMRGARRADGPLKGGTSYSPLTAAAKGERVRGSAMLLGNITFGNRTGHAPSRQGHGRHYEHRRGGSVSGWEAKR